MKGHTEYLTPTCQDDGILLEEEEIHAICAGEVDELDKEKICELVTKMNQRAIRYAGRLEAALDKAQTELSETKTLLDTAKYLMDTNRMGRPGSFGATNWSLSFWHVENTPDGDQRNGWKYVEADTLDDLLREVRDNKGKWTD